MSWTPVNRSVRSSRSPSIASRLIFFYVVFTSLLLVLFSVFLYEALVVELERGDTKFLVDEAQGLRAILKKGTSAVEGLKEEVLWEGGASKLQKYYVRVLDEEKKTIIQTVGMEKIGNIEKVPFPAPFEVSEYPDEGEKWKSPGGNIYLLMSVLAEEGDHGPKRLIELVSDITDDETLAAHYRRELFIALIAGVLLTSVIGTWIARRGLKPLKDITKSVQGVSATALHERISREKWPEELDSLAREFDQMLNRLEDSFSRLSQFSADLAHELRTPIHRLMGEAEVALSKKRTLEDCLEVIESSLEEYAFLSRMIDNLLFLARAEDPETVVEKTISEVRREVETVIEYYDASAKEKGLRVKCVGSATLSADFGLFRRALSNLLSNAIRHSPRGSEIEVVIEKGKDNSVEVKVHDRGDGIGPAHLPKIFNRFYRTDLSRSEYPRGMGLGLAIVKSIMKLHGGEAFVDSLPDRGTTFTLRFPS